jgi:hypothetical protein
MIMPELEYSKSLSMLEITAMSRSVPWTDCNV